MTNLTSQAGQAGDRPGFFPDGLDLDAIDALIAAVYDEIARQPRPTIALMNGGAAERRRRRTTRQAIASIVRALPIGRPTVLADRGAA